MAAVGWRNLSLADAKVVAPYAVAFAAIPTLAAAGGREQLQATTKNGGVPMHWAAKNNSSVAVIAKLLEAGGAGQLWTEASARCVGASAR